MLLPDPVDHHARRQRIPRIGDRLGQFQPAAALLEGLRRAVAQNREEMMRNHFTQILLGPSDAHPLDLRFGRVIAHLR
jgi:hypothetical protein